MEHNVRILQFVCVVTLICMTATAFVWADLIIKTISQ